MRQRNDHEPERLGVGQPVDVLAGAVHQHAPRFELARHVGAELDRQLVQQTGRGAAGGMRGEPQRRRRVTRAATHAGRDRNALADVEPLWWAVPARRLSEQRERASGEILALDAGAHDLVVVAAGVHRELVSQRDRLDDGDERVQAVRRAGRRRAARG